MESMLGESVHPQEGGAVRVDQHWQCDAVPMLDMSSPDAVHVRVTPMDPDDNWNPVSNGIKRAGIQPAESDDDRSKYGQRDARL